MINEIAQKLTELEQRLAALEVTETEAWKIPTTPYTSTSYDGDDVVAVGNFTLDTSAVFGIPAGVRAVIVYLRGTWATAGATRYTALTAAGDATAAALIYAQVANIPTSIQAIIPCNANGDIDVYVVGANMNDTIIRIVGYLL